MTIKELILMKGLVTKQRSRTIKNWRNRPQLRDWLAINHDWCCTLPTVGVETNNNNEDNDDDDDDNNNNNNNTEGK